MAKCAAKASNFMLNSVPLEDDATSITLDIKQETLEVTSFADAGPRRVVGNYDYSASLDGTCDFAAAQSDATLFAMVGSAGVAMAFDPDGVSAAADHPNYDSTLVVLESYAIKSQVGQAVTFSASMAGAAALARAVA